MKQIIKDDYGNAILSVETFIEVNNIGRNYIGSEYIDCISDVDVYFYTNFYEKLNDVDKNEFKLMIADAQRIHELILNRDSTACDEKELYRIDLIVKEYLMDIVNKFNLHYSHRSVDNLN